MLARRAGHEVSGADQHTYPPMSTLLEQEGIVLHEGYSEEPMHDRPDLVIIGNALSRGNPAIEYVLNQRIRYTSGPRWLGENYLRDRKVIAVAGTHGKTTTSSMVAWILECAGLNPGFLIGGVPQNFNISAREGSGYFVVEADEYDTAFFDKRSKFVHYRPQVAILNNLEYDHADIFPDITAIETQFHHLMRTIPGSTELEPMFVAHYEDHMAEDDRSSGFNLNLYDWDLFDALNPYSGSLVPGGTGCLPTPGTPNICDGLVANVGVLGRQSVCQRPCAFVRLHQFQSFLPNHQNSTIRPNLHHDQR